jgi:hypothetical protein
MTMLPIDSLRRSALQWLDTLQDTAVDLQEKALRETRLVYGLAPSALPVGPSRSLILALSLENGH